MTVTTILRGGLSNNLFGIAAVLGYSMKHMIDYCIPTKIVNPHYEGQKVFYSKNLKYCKDNGGTTATVYKEPHFHFAEIPTPHSRYIVLDGYYQSALYHYGFKDEILKILNIPYEFKKDWCSIHYRRGDYLNLTSYHPIVSSIYIQEAQMKMMANGIGKFHVFSDDIEFCRTSMPQFEDADYIFSEGKSEVEDLSLASSCEHNIGSNSAFSWWINYLNRNENKVAIFPKKDRWFGKKLNHNVENLYCPQWTLI